MAPKKTCDSSNKVVRKRVKKGKTEKPKLRVPTTVKVTIPLVGNPGGDSSLKLTKNQLIVQRKIELANEVAHQQLNKNTVIPEEPPTKVKTPRERKKQTPKPAVRQKNQKTISDFFTNDTDNTPTTKTEVPIKSLADSTMKLRRGKKATKVEAEKNGNVTTKENNIKCRKKPVLRRKGRPGKVKQDSATTNKPSDDKTKANTISSRTNSVNSNSNLSWTRDISSSSTTTCITVSSNDIVRYDKKIPIVQLTNIDDIIKRKNTIVSSDSENGDVDRNELECSGYSDVELESLNLSVSSLSDKFDNETTDNKLNRLVLLKNLDINIKNIDTEFCGWLGSVDKSNDDIFNTGFSDIINILPSERAILNECRIIAKILAEEVEDSSKPQDNTHKDQKEVESADVTSVYDKDIDIYKNRTPTPTNKDTFDGDSIYDNVNYTPFDQMTAADDDDALSLFAESITDLESSKSNTSVANIPKANEHEEYIPKPVTAELWSPEKYTYQPTKISNQQKRPYCEKQNADSTSLNIDVTRNIDMYKTDKVEASIFRYFMNNIHKLNKNNQPVFISTVYKPVLGIKSVVYKGICFYNLLSSCKAARCRFPHQYPEVRVVQETLATLNDDMFIQEYMLTRNWPGLRRKYGLIFVSECKRRAETKSNNFTRVLVEMGIDFVTKANFTSVEDTSLKINVLEMILMHLNGVDFNVCDDLLNAKIFCGDRSLVFYSVLLQAISDTQNFARFRAVFVKLVHFVVQNGGSFDLEVVSKILERVCILPCEETLAKAMIKVMQHTDRRIFQNSMMEQFEMLLSNLDSDVLREFLMLKEKLYSPQINIEMNANKLPHESPDTTNLDHFAKPTKEPIITRTIDFKGNQNRTTKQFTVPAIPPIHGNKQYQNWRNPSSLLLRFTRPTRPVGVTKRMLNQRKVSYQPTKFTRNSGTEY